MLKANGERQVEPTLKTITPDHKYRYQWVANKMDRDDFVLDACCGVGYGSKIMSEMAEYVVAFDIDKDAISYANCFYAAPNIDYNCSSVANFSYASETYSKIVCFEAIEHVPDPDELLELFHGSIRSDGTLYISSPNETVTPYSKERFPFHTRHWTAYEFDQMLSNAGFKVIKFYSQRDKLAKVMDPHPFGRTMIAECVKA